MNITLLTFALALAGAVSFLILLGLLSLLVGVFDFIFGGPKVSILKTELGAQGFAFNFKWNASKDPAKIDTITLRLFNPRGTPTQVILTEKFSPFSSSFHIDLDMGPGMIKFMKAQGFDEAMVMIEISSSSGGLCFQKQIRGTQFKTQVANATDTVKELDEKLQMKKTQELPPLVFGGIEKNQVADTVPGLGPQLKIATNPVFVGQFNQAAGGDAGAAGAAAGGAAAAQVNFAIKKVWIAEGCIVCNACEDIYPEVFDVQANTCVIRPNPPLDNGLKIEEAAQACPVEVIKFERA